MEVDIDADMVLRALTQASVVHGIVLERVLVFVIVNERMVEWNGTAG